MNSICAIVLSRPSKLNQVCHALTSCEGLTSRQAHQVDVAVQKLRTACLGVQDSQEFFKLLLSMLENRLRQSHNPVGAHFLLCQC